MLLIQITFAVSTIYPPTGCSVKHSRHATTMTCAACSANCCIGSCTTTGQCGGNAPTCSYISVTGFSSGMGGCSICSQTGVTCYRGGVCSATTCTASSSDRDSSSSYCTATYSGCDSAVWVTSLGTLGGSNSPCCGDDDDSDDFYTYNGTLTTSTLVSCKRCLNGGDQGTSTLYGNGYNSSTTCYYGDITCTASSASNGATCTLNCTGEGTTCCPSAGIYVNSVACTDATGCSYTEHNRDTEGQSYCEISGTDCTTAYWNSTNEARYDTGTNPSCCGDDANENKITRSCSGVCTSNATDWGCCNATSKCVYNGICYANGYVGDVDSDAVDESCMAGTWKEGTPPTWQSQGTNDTDNIISQGGAINLTAQGKDETALDWAWLATNETGSWQNITFPSEINGSWANLTGNVLLLHMNEGSGSTTSDSSGNGNTGTLGNASTWSVPTWTNGKFRNGLRLNGSQFVRVSDSSLLNITTAITLEAWIYPNSSSSNQRVVGKYATSNGAASYMLRLGASGNGKIDFYPSGPGVVLISSSNLSANTWYHVVATYNGSYENLYINGNLDNSTAATGNISAVAGNVSIGNNPASGYFFNGTIDEVAIYNRSLSADEIYEHYTRTYKSPMNMNDVVDTWTWSNFTWSNSSINRQIVGWKIYYNDTSGNENVTDVQTFVVGDFVSPIWQNQGTNDTDNIIGQGGAINLTAQGKDAVALDWSWLATNETGSWKNYTETSWWNSSWTKRTNITINNSQNSNILTNYQVFVNVTYDSDMNATFKDLRFTYYNSTSGTETEIPYWIESNVSSSYANVWVSVTRIAANSYQTVYMYYGNPSASSASDGNNTFVFFDDFNRSDSNTVGNGWTENEQYDTEILSNELHFNEYQDYYGHAERSNSADNIEVQVKLKDGGSVSETWSVGVFLYWNVYDYAYMLNRGNADTFFAAESGTGGGSTICGSISANNWGWFRIRLNQTNVTYHYSTDGSTWTQCRVGPRLATYSGAPSLLIVGKGYGASVTYTNPDLDNNWPSAGPLANYYADDLRVRKYSSPEPTASAGTEEQCLGGTYNSPMNMNDVVDTWTWSNFTWSNSSATGVIGWKIYYNDTSGNENVTDVQTFAIIDLTAPTITILSPSNTTYNSGTQSYNIWANITLNEAGSWCGVSLDSTANTTLSNTTGNWNYLMTGITTGAHQVKFYCNDTLNNMGSSSITYFTLDVPPLWQNQGTNDTNSAILQGGAINLTAQGKDAVALDWSWLATNESGSWQNITFPSEINGSWANLTGLVGLWHLSSINSTNYTLDSSGNRHDLQLVNFPCNPATCNLTIGKFGNGTSLNGYDDMRKTTSLGSLDFSGKNQITVEAWIFSKETQDDWARVIGLENSSFKGQYGIVFDSPGDKIYVAITNSTGNTQGVTYPITHNTWYHVAKVYNSTHVLLYMNGVLVNSTVHTGVIQSVLNPAFVIGTNGNFEPTNDRFNGTIDEVAIYNRSLSADEIYEHYTRTYKSPMNMNDVVDTWTWSNFTWSNSSATGVIGWKIYYNDTSGNENVTDVQTFVVGDFVSPTWQSQGTNDTDNIISQGGAINLTAQGKDETALDWAWLATNETGSWQNITFPSEINGSWANLTGNVLLLHMNEGSGSTTSDSSGNGNTGTLGNSSYCYQESANVSTSCGGLNSGRYSVSGTWTAVANATDGNWGTLAYSSGGYLYINYTKPTTAISSMWQVKDTGGTVNLTIPSGCWNYNSTALILRTWGVSTPLFNTSWDCFNGTWANIRNYTGNNVIYEEAMWWHSNYSVPTWTTGMFGNGLNFDGSDFVNVSDSSLLNITTAITLEAWMNPARNDNNQRVIAKVPSSGAGSYFMQFISGKTILALNIGGVGAYVTSTSTLSTNTWYHVVATYNGSQMKMYINGLLENTTLQSGAITATAGSLYVGANAPAGTYFNGTIDEVAIYNRSLSADEIYEHYTRTYKSPMNMNDVVDTWTWSNFTWSNSSVAEGAIVGWKIYYNDTSGNENVTDVQTFRIASTPTITIQSPLNQSYSQSWVWANVTTDTTQVSWCGVSLDEGTNNSLTNSSGNWNYNLTALTDYSAHSVTFYCNSTENIWSYSTQFFSISDLTPPKYFNVGQNKTSDINYWEALLFYVNWTDNSGLDSYIFSWNQSGEWVNVTEGVFEVCS